jgi:hypothetical protein
MIRKCCFLVGRIPVIHKTMISLTTENGFIRTYRATMKLIQTKHEAKAGCMITPVFTK